MIQMKLVSPNKIEKEEAEIPQPKGNQVLIRVKASSICGADMALFQGKFDVSYPLVMGHDFSGIIEGLGEKVNHLKIGDSLAVDPQRSCGVCPFCKKGLERYCQNYSYMGKGFDGSFQEYLMVEDRYVYRLPKNVSHEEAAIIEPFAVALHAFDFLRPLPDDTVVISGCGPIGLAHIQTGKAMGLRVVGLEMIDSRRKEAERFGAEVVLNPNSPGFEDPLKKAIKGRHLFVECAGTPSSLETCITQIGRGGILVMVGSCDHSVNLRRLLLKGITLYGARGGGGMYDRAISLISRGLLDAKSMISKRFHLEKLGEALTYNLENRSEVIKIILTY